MASRAVAGALIITIKVNAPCSRVVLNSILSMVVDLYVTGEATIDNNNLRAITQFLSLRPSPFIYNFTIKEFKRLSI